MTPSRAAAVIEDDDEDLPPSKSARKRESTDLQALGEALIALPASEFAAMPLPEMLRDAVELARRITAHGGLYRQKQYIGKLMRKIDAEPIRAALTAKRDRERIEAVRFRRVEQWRDRMIAAGRPAVDQFLAEAALEADARLALAQELVRLAERAAREQRDGLTPAASRELFRKLRESIQQSTLE